MGWQSRAAAVTEIKLKGFINRNVLISFLFTVYKITHCFLGNLETMLKENNFYMLFIFPSISSL